MKLYQTPYTLYSSRQLGIELKLNKTDVEAQLASARLIMLTYAAMAGGPLAAMWYVGNSRLSVVMFGLVATLATITALYHWNLCARLRGHINTLDAAIVALEQHPFTVENSAQRPPASLQ